MTPRCTGYDFSIDSGYFHPTMAELNTSDGTETIWFANPNALIMGALQCLARGLGMDETACIQSESLMELCNVLNIVPDMQLTQINTGCGG